MRLQSWRAGGCSPPRRSGSWPFRHAGPRSPSRLQVRPRARARSPRPARRSAAQERDSQQRAGSGDGGPLQGPWARWSGTSTARPSRHFARSASERRGGFPGSINLAIALLNDSGVKAEEAKKAGTSRPTDNFDESLELLAGVLEREPDNPHAHFCRGIILEQQGNLAEAHGHFKRVTEIDPTDAAAWYWMGLHHSRPGDAARRSADGDRRTKSKQEIAFFDEGPRAQSVPDAGGLPALRWPARFAKSAQGNGTNGSSGSSGSTPTRTTRCRRRGRATGWRKRMVRWGDTGTSSTRSPALERPKTSKRHRRRGSRLLVPWM